MRRVGRDHGHVAGTERVLDAGDGDHDLALDDVPHLFLLVPVLVERGRAGRDVVVRERHVLGVEPARVPPGERLPVDHVGRLEERHRRRPYP